MTPKSKIYSRYFTYIEPVIKTPIIKTYGFTILTIMSVAVFIIFAIKPTIETILLLQKDLVVQKETLEKVTQKSEDLLAARQNYQNIDESVKAKIQGAIPNHPAIKGLIESLENSTKITEASISALQFQPIELFPATSQKEPKFSEIKFTYNVEGTYQSLLTILDNIKAAPRIISLDTLIFSKIEGGSTLLMSVSGRAFYLQ